MYKHNIEACSPNHFNCGKGINFKYSQCVAVALLSSIQCSCIVLCCHLWPVWLYRIFPHYLINGTIFRGGGCVEHKMYVSVFSLTCIRNIYHSKRMKQDIIINIHRSTCKEPIVLVRFE